MGTYQQAVANAEKWGNAGWTIPPFAAISFCAEEPPEKREEADQKIMRECTNDNLEQFWNDIRDTKNCNIDDWDEAIANYKDERYKSCALLLYSMIEHLLIQAQKRNNAKNCKTGDKAYEKLEEYWQQQKNIPRLRVHENFGEYINKNVYACLKVFFANGKNFSLKDKSFAYRNMLMHGMFSRKVEPKDCMQLFFLYYNTKENINFFDAVLTE